MNELRQLYQEVILDHNRNPRNFRELDCDCQQANGYNPLCGDQVTVYLKVKDGVIEDICFQGKGCAISVASASLMTEALKGQTLQSAQKLYHAFHQMMTEESSSQNLGKLAVLEGVKDYPARIKCATLAWHATDAAISQNQAEVTTE